MLQTLARRRQTKPPDQYQNRQNGRRRGRLDARRRGCLDAVRRRRGRLDDEDDGADDDGGVWVLLHFQLRAKR